MRDQWITFIGRSTDIPWLLNQEGNRLIETRHFDEVYKKGKSNRRWRKERSEPLPI